jgi:serine/threonine protein kinase
MNEHDEELLRISESVSDGALIDWASESSGRPEDRPILEQLRIIESVAGVHRAGSARPQTANDDGEAAGWRWGSLRVHERIGSGAFAEVYRAYDPTLAREVALKVLRTDRPMPSLSHAHFLEEARKLARVRDQHVVTVHGADQREGRVGLWMDLIRGRTLEQVLAAQGPFGPRETVVIGMDLCRALAAIHRCGLVHGDVKTSNVMREEGGRIVLMDFGAVVDSGAGPSADALSYGTPAAMAPERLRGEPFGPTADVYGLGVLLYRLLTRHYPIEAESHLDLIDAHLRGAHRPLRDLRPDLSSNLIRVIEQAMDSKPERRFASVGVMERALARSLGRVAPTQRRLALVGVAALGLIAVVGGLWGWRAWQEQSERDPSRRDSTAVASPGEPSSSVRLPDPAGDRAATRRGAGSTVGPSAPSAITADVRMYRARRGIETPIGPGGEITPGDALFMDIRPSASGYVYVLDEDERGEVVVLFPLPEVDVTNPLEAGVWSRLPGRRHERPIHWQVTSPGGREVVMALLAREPLRQLEREIAGFSRATSGAPIVYGKVGSEALGSLRGIGGVVGAVESEGPPPRLSRILRALPSDKSADLWSWQIELANAR